MFRYASSSWSIVVAGDGVVSEPQNRNREMGGPLRTTDSDLHTVFVNARFFFRSQIGERSSAVKWKRKMDDTKFK